MVFRLDRSHHGEDQDHINLSNMPVFFLYHFCCTVSMQYDCHGIYKSPLASGLGQPLSSAVAQQCPHDFGLLQHGGLSLQTEYIVHVYMCVHVDMEKESLWASDKKLNES